MSASVPAPSVRSLYLHGVLFLSGAAGLGYEIVWIRFFAFGLGQEAASLLAVLTAYLFGIGLGALTLAARIEKSPNPARWCAGLEFLLAAWGLATIVVVPYANEFAIALLGHDAGPVRLWTVAFLLPLVALLPGTFALGAMLPAMDRLVSGAHKRGHSIAGLYGANTLGAVAGTLATTFILLSSLGFRRTLAALAAVNVACALGVLRRPAGVAADTDARASISSLAASGTLPLWIFLAGFLGLSYEVLCVRVISQVLENTIYTFAVSLAVFLFASALGAIVHQLMVTRPHPESVRARLAQATSIACLAMMLVLPWAREICEGVRRWIGPGSVGSISAEIALAIVVFLLPVGLMGALYGHLLRSAAEANLGVARAVGINTLGASLAPMICNVWLLPLWGAKSTLAATALGYLVLVPLRPRLAVATLVPVAMLAILPGTLVLIAPPPGGVLVTWREGVTATVSVVRDARGASLLKVNDRFYMGSTAGRFGARRMAHIPLLLHASPERAAFLGVGTGMTFGAAASYPGLKADGVELLPEVADLLTYFGDVNANVPHAPGLRLHIADARRYIRSEPSRYDVIVADLFHPALDGAGVLYTRDHFRAIRARLTSQGVFCQWLPLHQLDAATFRVIVAAFLEVFPESRAFIGHLNVETPALGLVGTMAPMRYPGNWYQRRVNSQELADALSRDGIHDELSLFGTLVANAGELRSLASGAAPQTDDKPVVMFIAPRLVYDAATPPWALLARILDAREARAEDILDPSPLVPRLDAYQRARDLYLWAEIFGAQGRTHEAMTALLSSVRASQDFATAYARLYYEAASLAEDKPLQARDLLTALAAAHPDRPEAKNLLYRLPRPVP